MFVLIQAEKAPYEPTGHFEKDYKEFCAIQKYPPIPLVLDRASGGSDKNLNDKRPKIKLHLDPTSDSVVSVSIADFAIDPPLARILANTIQACTSLVTLKCVQNTGSNSCLLPCPP
jgi:hypothetical protein